ncbi:MAG: hypothetical protein HN687_09305 [Candidatus Marinimicrobia bacterium]|jgi:hypothetical protein|nr:hypothetical protein [Candidatus Neomarinimicrobiota bacterium]
MNIVLLIISRFRQIRLLEWIVFGSILITLLFHTSFQQSFWKCVELIRNEWFWSALLAGGLVYGLLLSLPFIPGIEIGLLLMALFGKEGILIVYLCTLMGLTLSFIMGYNLPESRLVTRLKSVISAEPETMGLEWMNRHIQIIVNNDRLRKWLRTDLPGTRYLALAILFNLPGNFILGGGGGIALLCGLSRHFSWNGFLLTVMLSTAPVPLLIWFGWIQAEVWLLAIK